MILTVGGNSILPLTLRTWNSIHSYLWIQNPGNLFFFSVCAEFISPQMESRGPFFVHFGQYWALNLRLQITAGTRLHLHKWRRFLKNRQTSTPECFLEGNLATGCVSTFVLWGFQKPRDSYTLGPQ